MSHAAVFGALHVSVGLELLFKVYLEDRLTKAGELACCPLGQVCVCVSGHQVLDVLVLLLDNLVTWQLDEVLLVDQRVKQADQSTGVVEEHCVELRGQVLLNLQQLHLGVIDALKRQNWSANVKD